MTTDKTTIGIKDDERLAKVGFFRGLFRRVEIGALIGAVVIWLFFAVAASGNWTTLVGASRIFDPASTLGIMAIAVALLMLFLNQLRRRATSLDCEKHVVLISALHPYIQSTGRSELHHHGRGWIYRALH